MSSDMLIQDLITTLTEFPEAIRVDILTQRASAIDVIRVVTGKDCRSASRLLKRLVAVYKPVGNSDGYRFLGRGQRETPVCNSRGLVELIMLLPGPRAALLRHKLAVMYCDSKMSVSNSI